MQHSVQYGSQAYGLGLDEKLLSQYLNEKGYVSHTVGKVMTNLRCTVQSKLIQPHRSDRQNCLLPSENCDSELVLYF